MLIANNGTAIIAKKCVWNSPNKDTRYIVKVVIANSRPIVFLFIFIFCKYNKPPITGMIPMYWKIGIIEKRWVFHAWTVLF